MRKRALFRASMFGLAVGWVLLAAVGARACSVPVFQYAIERWPADLYHVQLEHKGGLTEEQQTVAEFMKAASLDEEAPVNVRFRVVDMDEEAKRAASKAETPEPAPGADEQTEKTGGTVVATDAVSNEQFPRIAVYFPHVVPDRVPVWTGPVTKAAAAALLDSPIRAEIVKRLLNTDSAVWVFLDSGTKDKDEAAFTALTKELTQLQEMLEVPDDPDPELAGTVPTQEGEPPPVVFSAVRLQRDDPNEQFLAASLLRTEPDLLEFDEPMAFPVFGRGRALYALVGKGINADNIRDACEFLVGACSCQVKALNPGVDLLMRAAWDMVYERFVYQEEPVPELTGVMPAAIAEDDVKPAEPGGDPVAPAETASVEETVSPAAAAEAAEEESRFAARALVVLAVAAVLLIGISTALMWRR